MEPIAAVIVLSLVVASLSVSGCTINTTSPTTSPTSVPDYSQYFRDNIIQNANNTPVNPITLTTNKTYVGTYTSDGNDTVWKIQLFDSKSEARANYGQLILQKTDEGFVSYSNASITTIGPTVFGETKATWSGYKLEGLGSFKTLVLDFGFNEHANQWYVASITGNR